MVLPSREMRIFCASISISYGESADWGLEITDSVCRKLTVEGCDCSFIAEMTVTVRDADIPIQLVIRLEFAHVEWSRIIRKSCNCDWRCESWINEVVTVHILIVWTKTHLEREMWWSWKQHLLAADFRLLLSSAISEGCWIVVQSRQINVSSDFSQRRQSFWSLSNRRESRHLKKKCNDRS